MSSKEVGLVFSQFKDEVYLESLRHQTPETTQLNFGSILVIPPNSSMV